MKQIHIKIGGTALVLAIFIFAFVFESCKQDQLMNENSTVTEEDSRKEPVVPANLQVPAGNHLVFHVYATGVQKYRCTAGLNNTFTWAAIGPDAELYADAGHNGLVGIHYAGPNWESNSGSKVRGAVDQSAPSPDPDAVPWLLLHAVTTTGPGIFDSVTFIQRVNTSGGKAPSAGCDGGSVGTEVSIPYTAEYFFYKAQN